MKPHERPSVFFGMIAHEPLCYPQAKKKHFTAGDTFDMKNGYQNYHWELRAVFQLL